MWFWACLRVSLFFNLFFWLGNGLLSLLIFFSFVEKQPTNIAISERQKHCCCRPTWKRPCYHSMYKQQHTQPQPKISTSTSTSTPKTQPTTKKLTLKKQLGTYNGIVCKSGQYDCVSTIFHEIFMHRFTWAFLILKQAKRQAFIHLITMLHLLITRHENKARG